MALKPGSILWYETTGPVPVRIGSGAWHNIHYNLLVAVFFVVRRILANSSLWYLSSGPSGLTIP